MRNTLTMDVESAPMLADTWGLFDATIGLNQVKQHSTLLSVCWKWYGESKVHYADAFGEPSDKALMERLHPVLDRAEVVIAHNGLRFDVRKINARMIEHGMLPYSPLRVLDTLRMAKRAAMFDSNKLEYLTSKLTATAKSKHAEYPGHTLWTAFMAGDPGARRAMRKYNIQDVRTTEELYRALAPWDRQHPVMATDSGCPRCGGKLKRTDKEYTTPTGRKYPLLQCSACGGWSRLSKVDKGSAPRKPVLAA